MLVRMFDLLLKGHPGTFEFESMNSFGCKDLVVGKILSAFGLQGEVKVKVYSDAPDRFRNGAVVYLEENDQLEPLTIVRTRPHKGCLLVTFRDYRDRTIASSLHWRWLVVPAYQASPLSEDEFYPHQVTGARVVTEEGEELGKIQEVLFTGANEVLVVQGPGGELLIPVLKTVVLSIDLRNQKVLVRLPPGLR